MPEPFLHHKVRRALNTDEVAEPNAFAVTAAVAAFTKGAPWLDALREYGCMRLGARIYDLKRQGFAIRAGRETSRNRRGDKVTYARYYMEG